MKILVISSYVPYPLYSGGQVRLFNLMRELSAKHEITLICERRSKQSVSQEDIEQLKRICKEIIVVNAPKQWSVKNIFRAGFSAKSFLITGHTHTEMQKKIKEALDKEKFDVIHIETFYVMQNLPTGYSVAKVPVVLVEHNIEYQVYERFMKRAPKLVWPLLGIDIAKIKREEENAWRQATHLVAVSEDDKKVMEAAGLHPVVVANGVNTDQFAFKNVEKSVAEKEKRIMFIGDFKWMQNRDAVTWIIKEVWPLIDKELRTMNGEQKVKLWIVGRTIPDSIKGLTSDTNIIFDEENSSRPTEKLFQEATVLLAPIRVGGGTSYKILEAMSCGTPAVITSLSANALQAQNRKEVLVGDTPEELAKQTVLLLQDKQLYKTIALNGRKFIEETYTWKEIAKKLEGVYK